MNKLSVLEQAKELLSSLIPAVSRTFNGQEEVGVAGFVDVYVKRANGDIENYGRHNLLNNGHKDKIFDFMYDGQSNASYAMKYVALTNAAITPAAADTTLTSEIAANGLTRAVGTYSHTVSTSTGTVTKTFTATGAQSAQAGALFSASSVGTMGHQATFTSVSLQTNDQLTVTWVITIS